MEEAIKIYTDQELQALWKQLRDIPVNWDEDSNLIPIPGVPESIHEPCLDENFHIWQRGVPVEEVWEWFDERHSKGVHALMYRSQEEG